MVERDESGRRTELDQVEEFEGLLRDMGPGGRARFCRRLRAAGELPPAPYPASPRDDQEEGA